MKLLLLMLPLLAPLALIGCDRVSIEGPPTLRLGRDECGECGMAIHDERSSAAILVEADGRRDYLLFDDIGCMLDLVRAGGPELHVVSAYVHDHSNNTWIVAPDAVFLMADGASLHTPMGSGLAAFADRAAAEHSQREFGGEILDYSSVADRRRERMEERRGMPGG